MKNRIVTFTTASVTLGYLLAFSLSAFEARAQEEAGNNLSYPAVLIEGDSTAPFFEVVGVEEGLGVTYSYGCEGIEILDPFTYPNTSCVDNLANPTIYYTAAECTAPGGKCDGKMVDRMYWQKEEDNHWSSQVTGVLSTGSAPVNVRYLDWGDSIEVVNWNDYSVLRVETQPFADLSQDPLPELPPPVPPSPQTQWGFQMWHVSGQGITEQWGVRVTEDAGVRGLPYAYQSPYAIINAGTADLYLSKLFPADANNPFYECPAMGGDQPPVYPAEYPFVRDWTEGVGWSDSCNLPIVPFTLEQSVTGKYVHGYNWRMRDLNNPLPVSLCGDPTWQQTGWWRLTFVPNGGDTKMLFAADTVTSPPEVPPAIPTGTFLVSVSEDDTVEGTLYTPVVDPVNNLTYIDICIVKKSSGEPPEYTVTPAVFGNGTISPSQPQVVEQNSTVQFMLDPDDYAYFGGVTGSCPAGTESDNGDGTWDYTTGTIQSDCSVIANFIEFDRYSLTVTKTGTGTGTVTSSPAGIDCGEDCTEEFYDTMAVTLTATPDADDIFIGWSGDADCLDGMVTMDSAKSCTATFTGRYTVTASASPVEGGGVSCSPNPVLHGSSTACAISTNPYYSLDNVTGTCGGTLVGTTYTTGAITADCTIIANFALDRYSLTVFTAGTGTGTVTSSPAGIDCGEDCTEDYDYSTEVALTAVPDADSVFTSWSGDADCSDSIVTMDMAKSCIATFTGLYTITSSASPPEWGGVSCSPNPVLHGSTSTCTINTMLHYILENVTGTCGGTLVGDTYTTDEITAGCTVIAHFGRFPWELYLPVIMNQVQKP